MGLPCFYRTCVSVVSSDETFGKLLESASVVVLFCRGGILPARDKEGTARVTADEGKSFLSENLTFAEYGVH